MNYLVTFHTHSDAIRYVKFLKGRNLSGKLQPVPRKVSTSCGTCVTFKSEETILVEYLINEGCESIFSYSVNSDVEYSLIYKEPIV